MKECNEQKPTCFIRQEGGIVWLVEKLQHRWHQIHFAFDANCDDVDIRLLV